MAQERRGAGADPAGGQAARDVGWGALRRALRRPAMSSLQSYLERTSAADAERVLLVTQDGRVIVGNLRGYDAMGSLVLSDCIERIFALDAGVEETPLGVYIVRGDSMYVHGTLTSSDPSWATWTWKRTAPWTGPPSARSPSRSPNTHSTAAARL